MFDHVTIRVADRAASEGFYSTVLATLGVERTSSGEMGAEWSDFSLSPASASKPAARGLHLGFVAPSRAAVDAFWHAGIDAGFADAGAPGLRPQYREDYYGAFLLDPDGNSAEAVHHAGVDVDHGDEGEVDHVWIRVRDLAAARAFYAHVAPHGGFGLATDTPERVSFRGGGRSFSLVAEGPPTEHLHLAFGAPDQATVAAFHAALIGAGYEDNGPPGERPEYHPGYYGAFVYDPDGNNVEVVFHDR